MTGDASFHGSSRSPEIVGDSVASAPSEPSQPPTWPTATRSGPNVSDDDRDALDEHIRACAADIEDNGDGTLAVIGPPSYEQREWLLVRYVEGGLSRDGRHVVWHPKEAADA